jgi:hypothetical protein
MSAAVAGMSAMRRVRTEGVPLGVAPVGHVVRAAVARARKVAHLVVLKPAP